MIMERVIWKFEKLFSIRFAHMAFPYSVSQGGLITDSLSLEPDLLTAALFKKHDIHFRIRQDMLLCFIRIKTMEDAPFFRLPNGFNARFLMNLKNPVKDQTAASTTHGKENTYRFRINVRASATSMTLSGASFGTLPSRDLVRVFTPGNPGTWTTSTVNLNGKFGAIDIVTEGSSNHRLYTDVNTQTLYYTAANGNENEHLFTIHLNN
jgi:hypothetical protein